MGIEFFQRTHSLIEEHWDLVLLVGPEARGTLSPGVLDFHGFR
jgi:hypothetical protein